MTGKLLLAAVLIMGLAMSVSAAEAVQNWFVQYFSSFQQGALSDSQMEYLKEHTQTEESQAGEPDTAVQLDSFLTDGQVVYATLNITCPEDLKSPGEGWIMEQLIFTDGWICPANQEKPTMEQQLATSVTSKLLEDQDEKENTRTIVLSLSSWDGSMAFTAGSTWKLHLKGLEGVWRNYGNERYLYEEKYAGQDVMLDGEEAAMITRWETISQDAFTFLLEFDTAGQTEQELVCEPLTLTGTRAATLEEVAENPQQPDIGPVEARLVSFQLSPLSYSIVYEGLEEPLAGTFNPGNYQLIMKDGRNISLAPYSGRQRLQEPIVLKEAEGILCPDGTMLMIPG